MKTILKTSLFVVAVLFMSSCTPKKTKTAETKGFDSIDCLGKEDKLIKINEEKPIIINEDSIFKQLGVRVFKDSSFIISAEELSSYSIPEWVFKMKKLKIIAINGMFCEYEFGNYGAYSIKGDCFKIEEISPQIKNLTKLTSLSLSNNDIRTLPIELTTLKNLKAIDFSDNPGLHDVATIEKIVSLEFLSFYGCHLTEMPTNIGNLKHLKELNLEGNSINEKEQIRIKKALPNCNIRFSQTQ